MIVNNKDRQQILTSKKLEAANIWRFWLKNDWIFESIIETVISDSFPADKTMEEDVNLKCCSAVFVEC